MKPPAVYSIYDDSKYAVLASWLFRRTRGRFGSLKVFVKDRQLFFAVSSSEKEYLKAVIGHLMAHGLTPGPSETANRLFRGFATAVCNRGGLLGQVYFTSETPEQKAERLLGRARSD